VVPTLLFAVINHLEPGEEHFFPADSMSPTGMFASFRISLLRPPAPAEAHSPRMTDLKHASSRNRNNVCCREFVELGSSGFQEPVFRRERSPRLETQPSRTFGPSGDDARGHIED
jgi:hypothetical protein